VKDIAYLRNATLNMQVW